MISRLLASNNKFHKGKEDTYEERAQDYIVELCNRLQIDMEEATYDLISKKLQEKYNHGADLATMIIKNGAMMKIGQ